MRIFAVLSVAAAALLWHFTTSPTKDAGAARPDVETWRKAILAETDWNDYIWPTNAGIVRTSSFCEFRSNHFHAGIDVSTSNQTGFDVYASRAGWVHSITFQPGGYGWLLVLRHADGFYTSYAHLKGFPKKVLEAYRKKLVALGRSYGLAEFTKNEVPVAKKEVVAYTGDTGAGPPHLHFEVRDRDYNPVHPELARNLRTADSIRPEIRQICFMPLDAASTVNGKFEPAVFPVVAESNGRYRLREIPSLQGHVGVLLRAHDRAQNAQDAPTPYSLLLSLAGKPLFESRFDRVQEKFSWHIRIDRDHWMMKQARGEFRKLFQEPGNELAVYYSYTPSRGVLTDSLLGDSARAFSIVATDIAGNVSTLRGELRAAKPKPVTLGKAGSAGTISVKRDVMFGELVYTIRATAPFTAVPRITLHADGRSVPGKVVLLSTQIARAVVSPLEACAGKLRVAVEAETGEQAATWSEELPFAFITPAGGGELRSPDGLFAIRFAPGDVYRSMFCGVEEIHEAGGTVYRVTPGDLPLAGKPICSIRCDTPASAFIKAHSEAAFLRFDRRPVSADAVSGAFGRLLGSYRLLRDATGPSISAGAEGRGKGRFVIRINDTLSGVDPNSLVVKIGSSIVPVEYSESQKCYFLPQGVIDPRMKGDLHITVADLMGNTSEKRLPFR